MMIIFLAAFFDYFLSRLMLDTLSAMLMLLLIFSAFAFSRISFVSPRLF